jgi:hypothetical protein
MLLFVLLNDCVSFSWDCGAALDQNRLIIHFLIGVIIVVIVVVVVVVILIVSASIQFISSHFWLPHRTMVLLIVMDSWFSDDV